MSKKPKKYSFPILKEAEILKCLHELSINIENNDLKTPSEEKLKIIYSQILETLMLMNINNNNQVAFSNLSFFEFPELHSQSISQISLLRNLIKFMKRVGVKDFCITDLILPDSQRTIRNLSAIINFAKFRCVKLELYQPFKEEEESLLIEFKKTSSIK